MKVGRLIGCSFLLLLTASQTFAQFSGPGFDKDVYIPEKGVGIDFLYSKYFDSFPFYLYNLGPAPGSTEDRISFMGYPGNPDYQTIFDAAPPFRLNNLKVAQKTNVKFPDGTIFGHFHSSKVKDALVTSNFRLPILYWADEEGLFDSSRRIYLSSSIGGDYGNGFALYATHNVYVARLFNDSLEDIIVGGTATWKQGTDSTYILLYRGGERLITADSIFQDTSCFFGLVINQDAHVNRRHGTAADFRGTGRKDFLASDFYGNWFFYKNDPPFTLEKFVASMLNDTLLAAWENPNLDEYNYPYGANRFTMQALPRPSWDKSVDFMPDLNTDDWRQKAIAIFRGGPHFGQNRLTLDSAERYLKSPALLDASWSGLLGIGPLLDAGDMTGTGNPVLMAAGSYGHTGNYLFFYTLGRAIDDKVDAVVPFPYTSLTGEQLSMEADGDKYRDVLFGAFNRTSDSQPIPGKSELWLLHGTSRIPAKLNPDYAVEEYKVLAKNILLTFPNPFEQKTVLTFDNCSDGKMYMEVINSLGKIMLREEIVDVDGLQQYSADLSMLVPGAYHIRLVCPADGWSAAATVIKQ